ncbi:ABC transporter permease [Rhizobium sp. P40RR-XXII]|uniref:ABC transporter permease n=1 Tax=unclassified Rhizobium TaxID=2613769 RepID=UPI0014571170|nr:MULTISPECIES: ABC transporter permease [unclassified Rhizobium]NLR84053.1 ABC transporter permease [Rhizobium sp. P28RR-XV]NLS15301.1 ABC transporter permease [Rhizobium sp. P40RR-XXII]
MIAVSILNRLIMAAITLFGVAVIVFVLLRVVPGDPIAMMISPGASPADIAALRAHYGLDASLTTQFWLWLKSVLTGDFGTSISLKRDVLSLLGERLPATLELAFAALALAVLLGGTVAIVGTLARRTIFEPVIDSLNGLFLAVPDFVWALALVLVLGVLFPLFPLSGRIDPSIDAQFATPFYLLESLVTLRFGIFADISAHMVMPVLALGLPLAAIIARVLKAALSEAMVQDYILLAKLKGMSELRLVLQEALRNAVGPTIALTGVQFTFLIGGTVIVERIFAYPGIGNMAIDAVINRDLPLIQGLVLVFGALFILVNLAVDLLVAAFNPRLAHG